MKNVRLFFILISLLSGAVAVRAQSDDPQSDYARAVRTYVDAATEELRGIRGQVDAQVSGLSDMSSKKRFDTVFAKLDDCDKLLVELKKAGPADFDKVKLKFEVARGAAVKALGAVNKS